MKNNQTLVSGENEKSQPSGQRIMPETTFPALSVYPGIGISLLESKTDDYSFDIETTSSV